MPAILKQQRLFTTKIFEITDKSLKVKIKKPFSFLQLEFDFEEITKKINRSKSHNKWSTGAAGAFCFLALFCTYSHIFEKGGSSIGDIIVYLILACVFCFLAYMRYENVILLVLYSNKGVSLYYNIPNEEEVKLFVNSFYAKQKLYYLNRYIDDTLYLTQDQISNNLLWLYDRDIINQTELEDYKTKLLVNRPEPSTIGFTFASKNNLN